MSETGGESSIPSAGVGAPMRPRPAATRRITRGNLWGILQGRLHVPMGDLRRQFQIDSDEVTPVQTPEGTYYVGLPADGAAVLGQLWHEGRIVFDCTPDLRAMVVRAIAPTRPTRPPPSRTPMARPSGSRPAIARVSASEANPGMAPVADRPLVARTPAPSGTLEVSYTVRPTAGAPRRTPGLEAADEFIPAPSVDAFGPGEGDLPAAMPRRIGATPEPITPSADLGDREAEATDEGGAGDDSARRRRRGGIGRASRAR